MYLRTLGQEIGDVLKVWRLKNNKECWQLFFVGNPLSHLSCGLIQVIMHLWQCIHWISICLYMESEKPLLGNMELATQNS